MKRTSRRSRLVRSAARSPARAITGPEVARKFAPSSRATICASVVLPRPGGPTKRTWSSGSCRDRAASMKTLRLAQACAWPTNSERYCGRSGASGASSSRGSEATRRGLLIVVSTRQRPASSEPPQPARQPPANDGRHQAPDDDKDSEEIAVVLAGDEQ